MDNGRGFGDVGFIGGLVARNAVGPGWRPASGPGQRRAGGRRAPCFACGGAE
jgi:hypothetical protein